MPEIFEAPVHSGAPKEVDRNTPSAHPSTPRLLIIGAGWAGQTLAVEVLKSGKFELLGFLDDRFLEMSNVVLVGQATFPIFGNTENLLSSARRYGANQLALAITHDRRDTVLSGLVDCFENDIFVHQMPNLYAQLTGKIPLKHIDEHWIAPHLKAPVRNLSSLILLGVDYLVSLFLILFLFLPMFPFVAIAIKLTSPGPLFFFQKRVGFKGKQFVIYKFRTMTQNAHKEGASWTLENDKRITFVGTFFRKFRIDELPQLFNVLRGEMALVGPRPEAEDLVAMYRQEIPFYEYRYLVKPGITGWAQVEYRNTCSVEGALEKLQYDLFWIKNRSPWLHFRIMFKTIKVMLTGFGSV